MGLHIGETKVALVPSVRQRTNSAVAGVYGVGVNAASLR